MDTNEAAQRAVGMLTAAYTAVHEDTSLDDYRVMLKSVLADMRRDPFQLVVSDTTDPNTIAQMAAEQATQQLMVLFTEMLATLISGFAVICRTYETDGPDADIYSKLREFGLSS